MGWGGCTEISIIVIGWVQDPPEKKITHKRENMSRLAMITLLQFFIFHYLLTSVCYFSLLSSTWRKKKYYSNFVHVKLGVTPLILLLHLTSLNWTSCSPTIMRWYRKTFGTGVFCLKNWTWTESGLSDSGMAFWFAQQNLEPKAQLIGNDGNDGKS